jgi:putative endonuclease
MPGSDHRRHLGALGEELARRHLEARGLTVLDSNFRTRYGELDLVAADDRCLVFCEVKTRLGPRRSAELGPLASVGPRKRRQVRRIAREWLAQGGRPGAGRPELRFDAIGIELDGAGRLLRLEQIEGAF